MTKMPGADGRNNFLLYSGKANIKDIVKPKNSNTVKLIKKKLYKVAKLISTANNFGLRPDIL